MNALSAAEGYQGKIIRDLRKTGLSLSCVTSRASGQPSDRCACAARERAKLLRKPLYRLAALRNNGSFTPRHTARHSRVQSIRTMRLFGSMFSF
ncbi:hypothetical protein EVAR_100689_1 [Eumeta japonica]|uniref:Uncharacterized protein n=1 Tax=Eumeta variegata TaxID=151549 RepID=A0A4C1ZS50_EUMVA|nr:hypothetical protein EVAR_100689_1 [Eumeta japonica]